MLWKPGQVRQIKRRCWKRIRKIVRDGEIRSFCFQRILCNSEQLASAMPFPLNRKYPIIAYEHPG
jgi:hypothetical protein